MRECVRMFHDVDCFAVIQRLKTTANWYFFFFFTWTRIRPEMDIVLSRCSATTMTRTHSSFKTALLRLCTHVSKMEMNSFSCHYQQKLYQCGNVRYYFKNDLQKGTPQKYYQFGQLIRCSFFSYFGFSKSTVDVGVNCQAPIHRKQKRKS